MSIARNECCPFSHLFCWGGGDGDGDGGDGDGGTGDGTLKKQCKFACKVTPQIKHCYVPVLQRDCSFFSGYILSGSEITSSLVYLKTTVMVKCSHFVQHSCLMVTVL